jgi:hypothetical protein
VLKSSATVISAVEKPFPRDAREESEEKQDIPQLINGKTDNKFLFIVFEGFGQQ